MNKHNWSLEIQHLGDRLMGLTVAQAAELGDYLETVHGIQAFAPAVVEPDFIVPDDHTPPPPPTDFDVVLEGYDPARKIGVIRVVREITTVGLKEALDLVQGTPRALVGRLPRTEAEKLKAQLEAAGGKVTLRESTPAA
jgi:large subunit ribosomal protein L7/L12